MGSIIGSRRGWAVVNSRKRRKPRKKKTRTLKVMSQVEMAKLARECEPELREMVEEAGFMFKRAELKHGHDIVGYHWMINSPEGKRLVDCTSTTGKYNALVSKTKGKVVELSELVDIALHEWSLLHSR